MTSIAAADLFCGAGGASTGLLQAAGSLGLTVQLTCVNHWPTAVETHTKNHPQVRHYCAPVETLDPRVAIPGGKLDLLIAAPECTHHSTARGGKPINDQSRASAWHILRWVDLLRVETVLIENVPEFQTWGPLGVNLRPLKSRKGETFRAFIAALESYGYSVDFKILNAADFGAATTRRRLFIIATRRGRPSWPVATHSKLGQDGLFGRSKKWRAAREVIDWSLPSQSIFTRKRPLQPATMRRILEGLRRFGGPALEPFLVVMRRNADARSLDVPLPTMTAGSGKGGGHCALAQPFLIPYHAERDGQTPRTHDVDAPLPVVPTSPVFGLVEPIVLGQHGGGVARPVSVPMSTLTADGAASLVEPFIVPFRSDSDGRTPRVKSVDDPMQTITTANRGELGLAEPFITRYYGSGSGLTPKSVDAPLDTVTAKDRFGLVQPVVDGYTLDIRFRMLQAHELAGAMSFPKSYVFTGNKGEQIKQIGNAVDCSVARALCAAILTARGGSSKSRKQEVA